MTENEPINITRDGITFIAVGNYYDGINNWVCHKIKEMDSEVIDYAARNMAKLIPFRNVVLVPVPGHTGVSTNALCLAHAIASYTGLPVVNALRGKVRESNYHAKHAGYTLTEAQMGFLQVQKIPKGCTPVIIDNCVDTGTSVKAAYHALGNKGVVLTYAISNKLLELDNYQNVVLRR